jgi:hypothetical protein
MGIVRMFADGIHYGCEEPRIRSVFFVVACRPRFDFGYVVL